MPPEIFIIFFWDKEVEFSQNFALILCQDKNIMLKSKFLIPDRYLYHHNGAIEFRSHLSYA